MIRHLIAATLALAPMIGFTADEVSELNFGFISTESSTNLKASWQPLLDDMSKSIGIPVKAFFASDYSGVIEGMRFNKVDVAWFGNKSAMEAVDRSGAEVFAKVINTNGSEGYWSLGIVHKDSPFQSVDDVLAKSSELSLGMGDPNSTSGTLVPGFYIFAKRGIDPQKSFKHFAGSKHEANIIGVATKQLDFATVASDTLERVKTNNPEKAEQIRVIWKSPLIASDPIAWRTSLPESMKAKVKGFLLNYGKTDEEKKIVTALKWAGFRESSNDQLIPIRQLALNKEKATTLSSKDLSDEQKQTKLAEIDRKLAELEQRLASLQK